MIFNVLNTCPEYPDRALWPDNGVPWKAWDSHVLSLCILGFVLCFVFWRLELNLGIIKKFKILFYF